MNRRDFLTGTVSATLMAWPRAAVPATSTKFVEEKFGKLPAGACRATGWLQRQMEEDGRGWVRTTNQMSLEGSWIQKDQSYSQGGTKAPFYNPYVERRGAPNDAPNGADPQAHWLDVVFRLGWVAGLEEYRTLGAKAVNDILTSLDSDGYIGIYPPSERLRRKDWQDRDGRFELWGEGETLNALLLYHRLTGEERVLKACQKASERIIEQVGPKAPDASYFNNQWSYTSMTNATSYLYRQTGDPKQLEMAQYIFQTYLRQERRFGDWGLILGEQPPQPQLKGHTASWGIVMLSGLELYRATGDSKLLHGLRAVNDMIIEQDMQPHGIPSGQREYLSGKGPYQNTELCDVHWWSWWWTEMAALTGESQFADLAEMGAFNALPGHRSKDGIVTAYFMCPNQLIAKKAYHTHYPARLYTECCQSNAPRTLPILVEHMVLATPDDGLAVSFYGSSEAKAQRKKGGEVIVTQDTAYPFEEEIRLTVQANPVARFPLLLRIPGWSQKAQILINGKEAPGEWRPGGWARVDRKWGANDTITLRLPMSVRVEFWNKQAVSVRRGPLLYTLPVRGDRKVYDKWGSFEEVASADAAWNYALTINEKNPESSFRFVKQETPAGGHVWDHSPVALEVGARRVPDWTFVDDKGNFAFGSAPNAPRLPERPFSVAQTTERVLLVPYGFTTLRMTYLPFVT
jgi:DUF1680 family protein